MLVDYPRTNSATGLLRFTFTLQLLLRSHVKATPPQVYYPVWLMLFLFIALPTREPIEPALGIRLLKIMLTSSTQVLKPRLILRTLRSCVPTLHSLVATTSLMLLLL